jgi:sulfur carrier protein ThiS
MKVTFKLYATLQDYLPAEAKKTNALTLDVDAATTIQQVIERFALPPKLCHLVLVDGNFVPPGERAARVLAEGETLAIWPPVAGG